MLEIFRKLRGVKQPTSEQLREALASIDISAAERAVQEAAQARREAIVRGSADGDIASAERALERAERALERARIAADELRGQIARAEADERRAALDGERRAAEAEAQACAAELAAKWPEAQMALEGLLSRLEAAEQRVRAVNEHLAAAGRADDLVQGVEWRARGRPAFEYEGTVSLSNTVVLPSIPEWRLGGHGAVAYPTTFWNAAATAPATIPRPGRVAGGTIVHSGS